MQYLKQLFRKISLIAERPKLLHILYASIVFSLLLVTFRMYYTGSMLRASLVWNLFLAYIPFALTNWMERNPAEMKQRLNWYICFVVWLVFIPNAPYIITDLFHLFDGGVPVWFELFLICSFAFNGMLMGYMSIRSMEKMWSRRYTRWPAWLFSFPVLFLSSLGVYIGRYLRYNSWDVVKDPVTLTRDLIALFTHPWENRHAWAFTICMGVFLSLMYPLVKQRLSRDVQ